MSHGTSQHPPLLKYSLDFESLKAQEAANTLPCNFWGKKRCCTLGVAVLSSKQYLTLCYYFHMRGSYIAMLPISLFFFVLIG